MKTRPRFWELTGYRLPTEAEWEFACRGGAVTSRYYGMSETLLPYYAWFLLSGQHHAWPVGSLEPNDFGLFDMLGNAVEICGDMFLAYPKDRDKVFEDAPEMQPDESGDRRPIRGGGFGYQPQYVRCALRNAVGPEFRNTSGGFRVVRTFR
jgi:formylglycine-generating enzyme required for sulfatase activity